jgi:hypothetical protein
VTFGIILSTIGTMFGVLAVAGDRLTIGPLSVTLLAVGLGADRDKRRQEATRGRLTLGCRWWPPKAGSQRGTALICGSAGLRKISEISERRATGICKRDVSCYPPGSRTEPRRAAGSMLERYTDRARRAVVLTQEEARMLNHNYIGTEHILLGLIHEGEGIAAKALESLGISLEAVRQQVEEISGQDQRAPSGQPPFTPRAEKVLKLALREALQLGHNYIGTEHILLGLIREGEGVAVQVLVRLGADLNRIRQQVIHLLHGYQDKEQTGSGTLAAARAVLAGGGKRKLLSQLVDRFDSMESRLSALEHRVGTGPDVRDLDQEIAQARRDKESAIDAQDFENAAVLRDREKQLLAEKTSRQKEWTTAHLDLPSLSDEVERLRDLLRQHGIEPRGGAA